MHVPILNRCYSLRRMGQMALGKSGRDKFTGDERGRMESCEITGGLRDLEGSRGTVFFPKLCLQMS